MHRMRGIVGYVLFLLWRPFVRRPRGFIYVACRVGGGWLLYYKGHVLVRLTRKKVKCRRVPKDCKTYQLLVV